VRKADAGPESPRFRCAQPGLRKCDAAACWRRALAPYLRPALASLGRAGGPWRSIETDQTGSQD
jgi:hypothetical protein